MIDAKRHIAHFREINNYLASNVNETNDYSKEIRIRIEKAGSAFNNMR